MSVVRLHSPTPIACLVITNPCGRKIGFRACQVAWKAAGRGQSNNCGIVRYPTRNRALHRTTDDGMWVWFYMYQDIMSKTCSWSTT